MAIEKLSKDILRQHKGVSFTGISALFFMHDGQGRLFLNKRSKHSRDEHGRWAPGAGGVKHGQTIEANMLRELKEEFATTSMKTDFLGYFDAFRTTPDGQPTHWLAMCFAVQVDPVTVCINEPENFEDSGWFTLDTLPTPLHSQFDTFFEKLKPQLEAVLYYK
jgi:ADP-ribose pyrophosphatase YjhB (NUDIX family)